MSERPFTLGLFKAAFPEMEAVWNQPRNGIAEAWPDNKWIIEHGHNRDVPDLLRALYRHGMGHGYHRRHSRRGFAHVCWRRFSFRASQTKAYRENKPHLLDFIKRYGVFLLVFLILSGSSQAPVSGTRSQSPARAASAASSIISYGSGPPSGSTSRSKSSAFTRLFIWSGKSIPFRT